jgi:hypothetical protein
MAPFDITLNILSFPSLKDAYNYLKSFFMTLKETYALGKFLIASLLA